MQSELIAAVTALAIAWQSGHIVVIKWLADRNARLEAKIDDQADQHVAGLMKSAELATKVPELVLEIQRLNQRIADMETRR